MDYLWWLRDIDLDGCMSSRSSLIVLRGNNLPKIVIMSHII